MSFKESIQRLWPNLRIPFRNAVLAALITAAISIFMPNWYRSEVRILPTPSQDQGNLHLLAATLGLGVPGLVQDPTANYEDILKSRWVGEQLLQGVYSFHEPSWRFGRPVAFNEPLLGYLEAKDLDSGMRALQGVLKIQKDLKSGVITIAAETRSPELSQAIARRASEFLNRFLAEKTQTSGSIRAQYTEERLKDARSEYGRSESSLKDFLETNRNYQISADPAVRLKGARLEMDLELRKQILTTLSLSREQALLDAKNDTPVLNVLDPGNLPIEKSRPSRGLLVIAMFLLVGLVTFSYLCRDWIKARLFSEEEPG
jgi:tyrosine-protein kinase Etk/Wzc